MKIRLTFWKALLGGLLLAAAYATVVRFAQGLGRSTNLSDQFPWGLWIGFDVLCGVMLAAGGFTLTAAVHIFNLRRLKPIVRPTVLTAFLGYALVCVALMFDLGRPYRIWHPLVMRNPHSVMFEVAWCVMLYTSVLALEFSPIVLERFRWERPLRILRRALIPLVVLGVILSTLHQSSLGTLYLIMPNKLHPFWYTPLLPVFFFLSAVAVGLAMTIFESSMSSKHFGRQLEMPILRELGRVLMVVLAVYAILRVEDLVHRGVLQELLAGAYQRYETLLFALELALALAVPLALLAFRRVRDSAGGLYLAAVLVVLGFITNRLNVSITGMESSAGLHYVPRWTEVAVTAGIIASGFALFGLAVKYLPIFPAEEALPALPEPETAEAGNVVGEAVPEHAGD
ncbi:MAG TPA: Ni/Fe-hydrogenase cytochrome b subunit [Terriglobales bacterium]|nr:Ni/Fe-hydrogenase cytochrome b subunit [Terriglobales bacterium]